MPDMKLLFLKLGLVWNCIPLDYNINQVMVMMMMITTTTTRANAQTIHIQHKGLLHSHLPYIINYHEHLGSFIQLFNRMTAQVLAFP